MDHALAAPVRAALPSCHVSYAEDHREVCHDEGPGRLDRPHLGLVAARSGQRLEAPPKIMEPEGRAPEEKGRDGSPERRPEGEAQVGEPQDDPRRDEVVDNLKTGVEPHPGDQAQDDEPALVSRRWARTEKTERQEENELAEHKRLDVARPGQDVMVADVGRGRHEEREGPARSSRAKGLARDRPDQREEQQGLGRGDQVERQARGAEERETQGREIILQRAGVVLTVKEDRKLPPENMAAHEAIDRLIGIAPSIQEHAEIVVRLGRRGIDLDRAAVGDPSAEPVS